MNFRVGTALEVSDGCVFHSCIVENAAFGQCNCAERTALFSAIEASCRPGEYVRLAAVGDTEALISLCGACRHVIVVLGTPHIEVILSDLKGDTHVTTAQQ